MTHQAHTKNISALCFRAIFSLCIATSLYGQKNNFIENIADEPGLIWFDENPHITIHDLASACAPVLWFSPDEPLLNDKCGKEIDLPQAFPFDSAAQSPVVYYQVRQIIADGNITEKIYFRDNNYIETSIINLEFVTGIDLDFIFYYESEEGLGRHKHDTEAAEFRLVVKNHSVSGRKQYQIFVKRVTAKAHGLSWYDNTLIIDHDTKFPIHILVEEGKHASCTDKNADGYYTPGYDVNKRVNDAWGIRDIIRSGTLFTGDYQAWMTEVRSDHYKIFPPRFEKNTLQDKYYVDGDYAPQNNKYKLRVFPPSELALHDEELQEDMKPKEEKNWPVINEKSGFDLSGWWQEENFVKSLSVAYRLNQNSMGQIQSGISFIFPLLIFKNVEEPISGGWLVNRFYIAGNIGYNILYTNSASRWLDNYFSFGVELYDVYYDPDDPWGKEELWKTDFVTELGVKFRMNLAYTPLKFLTYVTDFWGLRLGIKYHGFSNFSRIGYIVEIGAGIW